MPTSECVPSLTLLLPLQHLNVTFVVEVKACQAGEAPGEDGLSLSCLPCAASTFLLEKADKSGYWGRTGVLGLMAGRYYLDSGQ